MWNSSKLYSFANAIEPFLSGKLKDEILFGIKEAGNDGGLHILKQIFLHFPIIIKEFWKGEEKETLNAIKEMMKQFGIKDFQKVKTKQIPSKENKVHYFNEGVASPKDVMLKIAIQQKYVPKTCLLGGVVVMDEINKGNDPCTGCNCDRIKCGGRSKV